ncbi:xyloglucan O-acetyltransferase 1-like isoform X1 [Silene latifolia]|uniref:xyloglucan O-acetyltransferase 1-like isoform X1 n=1 Tax=Silene latifolia TaxID=37657 RepID=UPI003D78865B
MNKRYGLSSLSIVCRKLKTLAETIHKNPEKSKKKQEMGTSINSWKSQKPQSFTKKLLLYVLLAILPIVLLRFYLYPSHFPHTTSVNHFSNDSPLIPEEKETENRESDSNQVPYKEEEIVNRVLNPKENEVDEHEVEEHEVEPSSASLSTKAEKESGNEILQESKRIETPSTCDYTNGEWVEDDKGPLYNGSSCGTIKDGQNCMGHGRPDTGYLYWKWRPRQCDLQRFDPELFLRIIEGKHLAFVGDSMARNQLESLLCMLSSVSPPNLVYTNGDDNKFRRWHFPSHNANVSIYWSPFLVKGFEKTNDGKLNHNKLYFDSVDERWASDLDTIDMVVLSIGHWYLHPAMYFDGDSVLGCHYVEGENCTEVEFFDVFGKAFNTTLKGIVDRKNLQGNKIDVIVTTFSPHHFEGDWDKFGACPRTKPFTESEKVLEGMDANMRKVEVEEVENAKALLNRDQNIVPNVRVAALDVTKLAMLRPDGHPGPYMYPNPFADGIKERVQNDCVHWCLPGPIDTWNEIMFDIMKRWHPSSMR